MPTLELLGIAKKNLIIPAKKKSYSVFSGSYFKDDISYKKSPTSPQPIDRCLVQSGCSLTSRDGRGNSCLHWAAASHSSSAGKALAEMFLGQQEQSG